MNGYHRPADANFPPVVKNIIIITSLMWLITLVVQQSFGVDLTRWLALYYPGSKYFHPYQFVTHLFMHAGLAHLFFNMFAFWMFGRVLENVWGGKRFFIFYFVTGIGAAGFYMLVHWLEYRSLLTHMSAQETQLVFEKGADVLNNFQNFTNPYMAKLNLLLNTPVVGASGAVFGVLLGFGMLFPNTRLMLLFPPIPIKAKYFVIGYGALELYLALAQPGSNIAHVAHLGGMLFGYIMVKYWNKKRTYFY
ncbi:MAG TPA: rhomboid family intramembrane serine protease [Bacteroidetes bacterium]|nr:rhomboid family intramembrane serine protease [Bacteroidota bacterium]